MRRSAAPHSRQESEWKPSGAVQRLGPIVRLEALSTARLAAGEDYNLADLVEECVIAANTAAAGGNASLMAIG
jgi:RHH-type transcriptional regulator, proline utilization regulon repressor / proline dehydrogenase / delta 1-pyrroline-5-carboxylate dehydrogenase